MTQTHIDIGKEVTELQGVFPNISRSDFYQLDNGNEGVAVSYDPVQYQETFEVLIEYTPSYPDMPPKAWVQDPTIHPESPHVWGQDDYGDVMICYIDPDDWRPDLTSYDAAIMIQTWVFAYCNWIEHGTWDWDEKPHGSPDSGLFDLLPF